jgi:hypothetical protein
MGRNDGAARGVSDQLIEQATVREPPPTMRR